MKEDILREIFTYFELWKQKYYLIKSAVVFRAKFTLNAYIRKIKIMKLDKEKIKYKESKRKSNLKIRAEINETANRK